MRRFHALLKIIAVIAFSVITSSLAAGLYDALSQGEKTTLTRQFIAFGIALWTQAWAGALFERTRPFTRFAAQCVLAGTAAWAIIGVLRDVAGIQWPIGGEGSVAAVIGWVGAEAAFAIVRTMLEARLPKAGKS